MNWRGDHKFPLSFIIFFVLTFFLIGEQLPALPLYLGGPTGGDKVSILDLNPGDALHRPLVYFLIGAVNWILLRRFAWYIVWIVGAILAILEQFFLTPLDQRPPVTYTSALIILIAWGVFTLVPYFIYKAVDRRWAEKGRRGAILITLAINLLLLGFFAYQIFYLHHSFRNFNRPESGQTPSTDNKRFSQCQPGSHNNPPDCPVPQTKINSYLGVPCVSNPNPRFSHDLTEAEKIFKITPNSLIASKNQDRVFLWIDNGKTNQVPIYAPADADLVRGVYKISKSVATIDYDLHFQISCEVWFFINHVSSPVGKIKNFFPKTPATNTASDNFTHFSPPLHFEAGELIGYTSGTAQAHNFDLAVFDLNHTNNLIGSGGSNDARFKNFICPFNLFPENIRRSYYQKLIPDLVFESNCK